MILRYENNKLIETEIEDNLDFEDMVKIHGIIKKPTQYIGVDCAHEIRVYDTTIKNNFFIELTIDSIITSIFISGRANYVSFLKDYVPLVESLINLDVLKDNNYELNRS